MAYPNDLLSPSEHVVVHRHPHWKMLILPVLVLLIVVGGGSYLAALSASTAWALVWWIAIVAVGLVLILWLTLAPVIRWRTTHFVITSDRVMYRVGVFKRTGLDIPLSRINSVRFEHNLIDRVLGCGTLIIESASDEPLEFDDIPNVERVHTILYRELNDNPNDNFQPEIQVRDDRA